MYIMLTNKLYTLQHNSRKVKCDRQYLVSFQDLSTAIKACKAMKTSHALSSYTTNAFVAKNIDIVWRGALIQMGMCPDKLRDVKSREVTFTIDKRGVSMKGGAESYPLIDIDEIHPYSLFSLPIYENIPIAIIEEVIDDHPEMLCMSGIIVESNSGYINHEALYDGDL